MWSFSVVRYQILVELSDDESNHHVDLSLDDVCSDGDLERSVHEYVHTFDTAAVQARD
jgi:hypothetical protein